MSEEFIVDNCSPTLAGIKTGNLFSVRNTEEVDIYIIFRRKKAFTRAGGAFMSVKDVRSHSGCGSGALTIACAKKNPKASWTGIDRWGREYASFSRELCENNSGAEGVENTSFMQGDATALPFEDETFDAVTSNYVYHNIPSRDRQAILLETLRTLKKGGTFVIHDIMSRSKYGDMDFFVKKLKDMGYSDVNLIDTTDGKFMSKWESVWMGLSGSAVLYGKK